MTVATPFKKVVHPNMEVSPGNHARMAGELVFHLLHTSIGLGRPYVFVREMDGWRIRIEKLGEHRAMIATDLGLDP